MERKHLSIAVVIAAIPAALFAQEELLFDASRASGAQTVVVLYVYDIEGKAGVRVGNYPNVSAPGVVSSAWGFEDGSGGTIDGRLNPVGKDLPQAEIPYWWEATNPWTGTWRGWSTTKTSNSTSYDSFVIPIPASKVGLNLRPQSSGSAGRFDFFSAVSLADSLTEASPIAYHYLPYSGLQSRITAIYPPESPLSGLGTESHLFGVEDGTLSGNIAAQWGNYTSTCICIAEFSHTIPSGPLSVIINYEGTTPVLYNIIGASNTFYSPDSLVAPLPNSTVPNATALLEVPAPPEWIIESSLVRVLTSRTHLTTDLQGYSDLNGDGIFDSADLGLLQ